MNSEDSSQQKSLGTKSMIWGGSPFQFLLLFLISVSVDAVFKPQIVCIAGSVLGGLVSKYADYVKVGSTLLSPKLLSTVGFLIWLLAAFTCKLPIYGLLAVSFSHYALGGSAMALLMNTFRAK